MKPDKFKELVREFQGIEEQIMRLKREDYASGEDRLQNVREVARFTGINESEVALTYLLKHIQSIKDAVMLTKHLDDDGEKWCWNTGDGEGLKQRIADARNYLLLLAACIEEEVEEGNEQALYMEVAE